MAAITGLSDAGFSPQDLSDDELAKTHGRHLVGGRAAQELTQNESIYRFEFPERPEALGQFLALLPKDINISLFHYRNHGSDIAKVLTGFQVPDSERDRFSAYLQSLDTLGYRSINDSDKPFYK